MSEAPRSMELPTVSQLPSEPTIRVSDGVHVSASAAPYQESSRSLQGAERGQTAVTTRRERGRFSLRFPSALGHSRQSPFCGVVQLISGLAAKFAKRGEQQ
jgi:hypothetical protein